MKQIQSVLKRFQSLVGHFQNCLRWNEIHSIRQFHNLGNNFNWLMDEDTDKKKCVKISAKEVVLISLILIVVALLFIAIVS